QNRLPLGTASPPAGQGMVAPSIDPSSYHRHRPRRTRVTLRLGFVKYRCGAGVGTWGGKAAAEEGGGALPSRPHRHQATRDWGRRAAPRSTVPPPGWPPHAWFSSLDAGRRATAVAGPPYRMP